MEHEFLIPGLPEEMAFECLIRVPLNSHSTLKSVCRSWKNLFTSNLYYKERRKWQQTESLVFLVQAAVEQKQIGLKKHETSQPHFGVTVYNASHDAWQCISIFNENQEKIRIPMFSECVVVPSKGKVLLIGGWDPVTLEAVADVYVLDLWGSGSFRRGASMAVARSFFGCSLVGDSCVYVAGGHDNGKNALRSAEVYNVDDDTWHTLPPMTEERDECKGMAVIAKTGEERFWVVSGYGTESQGRFGPDAEVYDPVEGFWSKVEGFWVFPESTQNPKSIIVMKSTAKWRFIDEGTVKEYNESEKIWKVIGKIPDGMIRTAPCVTGVDENRLFMMGPCDSNSLDDTKDREGHHRGFILESSNGKWTNIEIPSGFSGFVYSASSLLI